MYSLQCGFQCPAGSRLCHLSTHKTWLPPFRHSVSQSHSGLLQFLTSALVFNACSSLHGTLPALFPDPLSLTPRRFYLVPTWDRDFHCFSVSFCLPVITLVICYCICVYNNVFPACLCAPQGQRPHFPCSSLYPQFLAQYCYIVDIQYVFLEGMVEYFIFRRVLIIFLNWIVRLTVNSTFGFFSWF